MVNNQRLSLPAISACCTRLALLPTGEPRRERSTSLYKSYRYVPPQRVWFLGLFGLKTGIHFAHFGQELGMAQSRELRECMNVFIVSIPSE